MVIHGKNLLSGWCCLVDILLVGKVMFMLTTITEEDFAEAHQRCRDSKKSLGDIGEAILFLRLGDFIH